MSRWRFLDYYTGDEPPRNLIREWYSKQDKRVQAAFDATLNTLEGTKDWADPEVPEFKFFETGEFAGLSELRFHILEVSKETKRQIRRRFRIPGIWYPVAHEFILLLGCEKSGRIKIPQNAFELAMELKLAWEQEGRGSIDGHK